MITLVEAFHYRCLQHIKQPLGPFHVLVGANASGKTTFLDAIAFLGELVSEGLEKAVAERTPTFEHLLFGRRGHKFELAVEAQIPPGLLPIVTQRHPFRTVRYEVAIGLDPETGEIVILSESVKLKSSEREEGPPRVLFPDLPRLPETIAEPPGRKGSRTVVKKVPGGNDNFYSEVYGASGKGWAPAFRLGPRKSALGNLPEDESKFPVSTWLKGLLSDGVQKIILDSLAMRHASPPGQSRTFKTDGSNLPWVIADLKTRTPHRFTDWICHLQTALPDLEDIQTVERQDDKHRYLVLCYRGGLQVPSWTASDGTLRLLALTLPAYLPHLTGVYLIEEPENGIHPRAIETMYQSLSNVYDAQVLMATHSPVILSTVEASQVLCFAKTEEGATDIISGDKHPSLSDWQGEMDLGLLFASGVLG